MKILYHHRTRGTDAQRVHILEIVNAFRELGHTVDIASLVATEQQNAEREASEASWKGLVRRVPFAYELVQLGYNLFGLPWLLAKLITSNASFVYERYSLFCFCGVLAARLLRKPIVLEVNSPFALEQGREQDIRAVSFACWMERVVCNAATKVIVVSGPLKRIMEQNGVLPSKLVLMPNGVNLRHIETDSETSRLRQRLDVDGRVVVGFIGWFKKWHGLELLIDVFAQAKAAESGAVLLLIGDGPAMESMRASVAENDSYKGIVFTGPVAHEDVPGYLNLLDIAVQPAANEYCCPMKIIEYMGAGKAIVAPRQENIEDLLPADAAIWFRPGDGGSMAEALLKAVNNSELRQQKGARAKQVLHSRGMLWLNNAERVIRMVTGESMRTISPAAQESDSVSV
jgi:glycosyltransferase involved in cell wall biosynthesis